MTSKSLIISATERALTEIFRAASFVPEDKLTWQAGEGARPVMNILQECAHCPSWSVALLKERKMPEFTPEFMEQLRAMWAAWNTPAICEAQGKECLVEFKAAIEAFPESDMEQTMFMPFGGGREFAFWEVMMLPYWNLTYHLGQINYVQTLYGDKEMH